MKNYKVRSLLFSVLFAALFIVARLSMALKWPDWLTWTLMPLVVSSGFLLLMNARKGPQQASAHSGVNPQGNRFSRSIGDFSAVIPTVNTWAEKFGYRSQVSTPEKTIYSRNRYFSPIFVSLENVNGKAQLEAWTINPNGNEEPLTSGFSYFVPNKLGTSDVNKLMADLDQPRVDKAPWKLLWPFSSVL